MVRRSPALTLTVFLPPKLTVRLPVRKRKKLRCGDSLFVSFKPGRHHVTIEKKRQRGGGRGGKCLALFSFRVRWKARTEMLNNTVRKDLNAFVAPAKPIGDHHPAT